MQKIENLLKGAFPHGFLGLGKKGTAAERMGWIHAV